MSIFPHPRPSVVAVACVRDEGDIVEAFVRHALAVVDRLIVLDNGSTDETPAVLASLQAEGLPLDLLSDPSPGKYHARRYTELMRDHAVGRWGADWVLTLDADEFLVLSPGRWLVPVGADPSRPIEIPWRTYVPRPTDYAAERNPVLRIRHRLRAEPTRWSKLLVPRAVASDPAARLSSGSHEVFVADRPCPPVLHSGAVLAHFPIRSAGQYRMKVAVNSLQYLSMPDRACDAGWHYREPFERLKSDPAKFDLHVEKVCGYADRSGAAESAVVDDPLEYRGGPIRYGRGVTDADRAWVAVLGWAEGMAKRYAGMSPAERDASDSAAAALHRVQADRDRLWDLSDTLQRKAERFRIDRDEWEAAFRAVQNSRTVRVGRVVSGPFRSVGQWARGFRRRFFPHGPARILLGAGDSRYPGWHATNADTLNVTDAGAYAQLWAPHTRSAFLAEHVWEHLTEEEAHEAFANCFRYLKPGGRLRVAVPDGLHPEPAYRDWVRPGGTGPGAVDHRQLYTYRTLTAQLRAAGFRVRLLEYWDESGRLHTRTWKWRDGPVRRSVRHDRHPRPGIRTYTSLIADAFVPRRSQTVRVPFSVVWRFATLTRR